MADTNAKAPQPAKVVTSFSPPRMNIAHVTTAGLTGMGLATYLLPLVSVALKGNDALAGSVTGLVLMLLAAIVAGMMARSQGKSLAAAAATALESLEGDDTETPSADAPPAPTAAPAADHT